MALGLEEVRGLAPGKLAAEWRERAAEAKREARALGEAEGAYQFGLAAAFERAALDLCLANGIPLPPPPPTPIPPTPELE